MREGLVHRHAGPARIRKDRIDPLSDQSLDEDVGSIDQGLGLGFGLGQLLFSGHDSVLTQINQGGRQAIRQMRRPIPEGHLIPDHQFYDAVRANSSAVGDFEPEFGKATAAQHTASA
jgi:hypothetical protein